MTSVTTKMSLGPDCRRLVEIMQELGFGQILDIPVRKGRPILNPPPRCIRLVKFCAKNGPRPEVGKKDFTLKARVRDLFAQMRAMGDGTILCLTV